MSDKRGDGSDRVCGDDNGAMALMASVCTVCARLCVRACNCLAYVHEQAQKRNNTKMQTSKNTSTRQLHSVWPGSGVSGRTLWLRLRLIGTSLGFAWLVAGNSPISPCSSEHLQKRNAQKSIGGGIGERVIAQPENRTLRIRIMVIAHIYTHSNWRILVPNGWEGQEHGAGDLLATLQ